MADLARKARDMLAQRRGDAANLVAVMGMKQARALMIAAQKDLQQRLKAVKPGMEGSFTQVQLRASLAQVTLVLKELQPKMKSLVLDIGQQAAERSAANSLAYLQTADKMFRGVGEAPLAIREASYFDAATQGARSSILARLASSGEPVKNADAVPHRAKLGILDRYGLETIDHFEKIFRTGMIAKKSMREMRDEITEESSFLRGAPAYWATRIVRTEVAGAYNRAGYEAIRESDKQLGDMLKIQSAVFDDRTASDSYATHGQIRLPEEPFETWYGAMQHPPDRPNDRGIVVPHRKSWTFPEYLTWKTDDEIADRWKYEGRKGEPPERPLMTTVDLDDLNGVPPLMYDIQP